MRKIFNLIFTGLGFFLIAGPAAAEEGGKLLSPADAPSEFHKDSDVIDVDLLRKRIKETPIPISTWIDKRYDFQFDYPARLKPVRQFGQGPLENGNWSWFVEKEKGLPLVSITLPNASPKTMTTEIRIGVSEDSKAVSECRALPEKAQKESLKTFRHKGHIFTYFTGGTTSGNKFITVSSYRTVHLDRCYAIELMVHGTQPTASQQQSGTTVLKPDEAMKRLDRLWRQMNFQWISDLSDKK